MSSHTVAVLGAGIQGCCLALDLARRGHSVDLFDRWARPFSGTSAHTEGKIHLGFVYAKDPRGETHRLMVRGSLAFATALREIAGLDPHLYTNGSRFHYAVPHHSQLSAAEVEAHFQQVEDAVLAAQEAEGGTYLGRRLRRVFRRLGEEELSRYFARSAVQAAFETEEEAIDTLRLAELLRSAVAEHPRVRFIGATRISNAAIESEREVRLVMDRERETVERCYAAVANCLWDGRLALDAALGLVPQRPWLFRFKAVARLAAPELSECRAPSTTLIVGSFGDVVNYGGGLFYLSWYPRFKLAETHGLDGSSLYAALDRVDRQRLAREGVEALAGYVPDVACLLESRRDFQVGGGVIFGWGSTDIDDPESGLHQRWRIGPRRHGPYVSVDTGKYTTAPLFALETSRVIEEILN